MSDRLIGRRIIRVDTVGSTMDEVARLAANGEPEGTVVVAEVQTAGRGRAGRVWEAPRGTSILCSLLLRPVVPANRLPILSLLTGVAVAEALEASAGVTCRLKWPNDVWIDGRKVAGILVNARSDATTTQHAIVGIGINVNVTPDSLVPAATSLLVASGRHQDREVTLHQVIDRLDAGYRAFIGTGGNADPIGWQSRAALVGEMVSVRVSDEEYVGRMRGIDDEGALLLEGAEGQVEAIQSGELTRGPRNVFDR